MRNSVSSLPDVIADNHEKSNLPSQPTLNWVGMEKIGLPVNYILEDNSVCNSNAQVDIFVSLDTSAKGIHMSRLYLQLNELIANQPLSKSRLNSLLDSVLASHAGISESAMVRFEFDLAINKPALLSENQGYQVYPVVLTHKIQKGQKDTTLELSIPYSSTCPCSASLANQLISEAISQQFPEDQLSKEALLSWLTAKSTKLATPHNQRSYAYLKLELADNAWPQLDTFIAETEKAIGTPVQTAVKREDEQEFARLNGSNLMFCEDAARRMKQYLQSKTQFRHFWFKVEHQESLHAHNAVAIDYSREK